MFNCVNNAFKLEKMVYQTRTAGAAVGTMFDAFCKTMSKSNVARQSARDVVKQTADKAKKLEEIANKILKNSKSNAIPKVRVKGVNSTASKIKKKFIELENKGYEASREKVQEIFFGNGVGELVGDSYGFRYILQNEKSGNIESSIKLYESILNFQRKHPRKFRITGFEDYYGKGIKPYGNEAIRDKYAELQYRTSLGKRKETLAAFTEKPSGYTRTNINVRINGVNTEIQIGGLHTTKWGDVEHILYDMRQGKPLDMSKYTQEQKELAYKIRNAYKEVLKRKTGQTAEKFSQEYLTKVWDTSRKAEILNSKEPLFPVFPQGYPEILKAENILKLAHD